MQDVMSEAFEIFKQKNKAYGNSVENSLDKHGIVASLVRLDDKLERLTTLGKLGTFQAGDESIIDTAVDLGNYALMLACYLKGVRDHAAQDEPTKYPGGLEGHVSYHRPRFQPRDSAIEYGGTTSVSMASANHSGVGFNVPSVPPARE